MTLISVQELKVKIDSENAPIIIDVRESWEYNEKNMGALNIPLNDLPKKLSELDFCKDKEVVVHCQSGKRSNIAMKYLHQNGFVNVKSLEGGIEAAESILLSHS